jgi:hypothetical protein
MIEVQERRADTRIAREREARHLRKENEVSLLELKRADPVKVEEACPLEEEAEGRILIPRFPDAPRSGSAHDLREDGLRTEKGDDGRERIRRVGGRRLRTGSSGSEVHF